MQKINKIEALKSFGYSVNVEHLRMFKIAYVQKKTKKICIEYFLSKNEENLSKYLSVVKKDVCPAFVNIELLACGGRTIVSVYDPNSGCRFESVSTCRDDENFCRETGRNQCFNQIIQMMKVRDGQESFIFNQELNELLQYPSDTPQSQVEEQGVKNFMLIMILISLGWVAFLSIFGYFALKSIFNF